jgi:hypothetical protein
MLWPVAHLYDESIDTETGSSGTPTAITWRGSRMHVRSVLSVWQSPDEHRLYRLSVTTPEGNPGIAEISGTHENYRMRAIWL